MSETPEAAGKPPLRELLYVGAGLFLAILAALVVLVLEDKPTDTVFSLLATASQLLGGTAGVAAVVVGAIAARNSHAAKVQTNGSLDQRIREGTRETIREELAAFVQSGPTPPAPGPQ